MALHFCKKCGRVVEKNSWDRPICDCCNSTVYKVPEKYWLDGLDFLISEESEQLLIEELVKTSPEFDQYLFDNRDKILSQKHEEFQAKINHGKAVLEGRDKGNKFGIECPYCHATNVKKISVTSKVAHTALFGIFSMNRNGKRWHCNKCNSDF